MPWNLITMITSLKKKEDDYIDTADDDPRIRFI
jgi:hypothetical protein